MSALKDMVVNAGMAVGNVVAGERDRPATAGSVDERIKKRVSAVVGDTGTKTAASVGAPVLAGEVAKRTAGTVIGKVAASLANHPAAAAGAVLLAVDAVRDGVRVARGDMKPSKAVEHLGASATGLVGGAGGAYAGAMLGTVLVPLPIVGTVVGGIVGSVAGTLAGDQVGRTAMRTVLGAGKSKSKGKKSK